MFVLVTIRELDTILTFLVTSRSLVGAHLPILRRFGFGGITRCLGRHPCFFSVLLVGYCPVVVGIIENAVRGRLVLHVSMCFAHRFQVQVKRLLERGDPGRRRQ